MKIQSEIVREVDEKEWNNLINRSTNSTVFHTLEWMKVMEKANSGINPIYIITRDNSGEICGGLQLYKNKIIPGFYMLESPPWGNPLLTDENREETRQVILDQIKKIGKKFRNIRIFIDDLNNICTNLNQCSFEEKKFFSYNIKLENSFDWLWKNKPNSNIKWNYKKAVKNNVYLKEITNLSEVEEFYKFSAQTEIKYRESQPAALIVEAAFRCHTLSYYGTKRQPHPGPELKRTG